MVFDLKYTCLWSFSRRITAYKTNIKMNVMKNSAVYESPRSEIVKMETEQVVLVTSITGESIEGWEDM